MPDHKFVTDDGVEIAFEQWGDPTAPTVLLHHGLVADTRVNWEGPGVVEALVAAGHHVVALDARGHHRSGKPHDPASYGERRMAADVAQLLDALAVTEPGSVDLVGYSMGAVVSLLVAAGGERRLRRLVVGGVGRAVVERGGIDSSAMPGEVLAEALLTDDPGTITHEFAAAMRGLAEALDADRVALACHARVMHAEPFELAAIDVPTLVFAGDADPLAAAPHLLADAVPGAKLAVLGGDHVSVLDNPDLVRTLVEFLS